MQVRDLIHLLQTRCKPEQEVVFTAFAKGNDEYIIQVFGESDDSFSSVWAEAEHVEDCEEFVEEDARCIIDIGNIVVHNLLLAVHKGEINTENNLK